jgi:hypothetical protein
MAQLFMAGELRPEVDGVSLVGVKCGHAPIIVVSASGG